MKSLNGPEIRDLVADPGFRDQLDAKEKEAFESIVAFSDGFLGNFRAPNYKQLVKNLKRDFKNLGVLMSVKVHLAIDHTDDFAPNCGGYSDEQGESVHQVLLPFERRFKGHDYASMLSEYAWSLDRDSKQLFGRQSSLSNLCFKAQRKPF